MRKDISFLDKYLIAHRGVHYIFKENTLSAFSMAIDKGYAIELDVHLSFDKEIVVFHDYNLLRLYKRDSFIKNLKVYELRKYNIPTLSEVLNLVGGRVPVIIEVKVNNKILLTKLIKLLDEYSGEFAIQSFNPLVLLYFKVLRSNYVIGYLTLFIDKITYKIFLNNWVLSRLINPDFIGVNLNGLKNNRLQKLRSKYIVVGYTIKSSLEYEKYYKYADNFICDVPKNGIKKQETAPLRTVSQKE